MWRHFAQRGIHPESPQLKQSRADLFEIYCSQDSQLTKQACNKGLWAERHGLSDGDLTTAAGRHCLYDRLLQLLPRNIWLAPRCKAWCRWNEFNRHKSQELALKIMEDRQKDQVHLLLCDALFQFQTIRAPDCHAHLEQPVGSQMLYQEELAAVLDQAVIGRCDMCTAGQLRHPQTQRYLQKGTQIVTTSEIMQKQVESMKCPKNHMHDHVAGTCLHPQLGRVNVSQYSELYTRVFAEKISRCLQCIVRVEESNRRSNVPVFVTRAAEDDAENVSAKRRKLGKKQPPDAAHQQLQHDQDVSRAITEVSQHAPKVGKRFFFDGPVVQSLQQLYPMMVIKCVELCKGADKLRCPPTEITKEIAPYRRTLGIHRNLSGNFEDADWEEWGCLSRRRLTRNGNPARLLISVFAQRPEEKQSDICLNPVRPLLAFACMIRALKAVNRLPNVSVQQHRKPLIQ
eukprot:s892_g8.t1